MFEVFDPFFNLLESGGDVLLVLFFVGAVLVENVVERIYYYNKIFKGEALEVSKEFSNLKSGDEEDNLYLRQMEVSRLKQMLSKRLSSIQTLTYMFPLLGLLGTVTGMIAVFDVMAHKGLGNPRLMASGVSQATLPTMVGMVMALVGLFAMNYLKHKKAKLELELNETFKLES
jgi:biopolymer transport protein ExbB